MADENARYTFVLTFQLLLEDVTSYGEAVSECYVYTDDSELRFETLKEIKETARATWAKANPMYNVKEMVLLNCTRFINNDKCADECE